MKMRVGHRLLTARQDRKLSQTEMSDFLGLSPSAYSRLERDETSAEIEQIINFSKKLDIPIQDFLPETITFNGNNQNGQIGLVIGNIYHYSDKETSQLLSSKDKENHFLIEKIALLEKRIADLEEINQMLKNNKAI